MFEITLRSGACASTASSNRSMTVAIAPALPFSRRASSSGGQGRSSALCSTSNRFESDSTISGKTALVTSTAFILRLAPPALRLLVEHLRQPQPDLREQVQQD